MREYKFRGKEYGTDEWRFGELGMDGKRPLIRERLCLTTWVYRVDRDTVGQFTGRQDVDGEDIYEGDIVDDGKRAGVVKWMQGKCCYQVSPGGVFIGKEVRVIGNIYDNPELLKT